MRLTPLEHEVQKTIVDSLVLAGFTVKETTAYKQKGASGVDKGIPDLLVFHPLLRYTYHGQEVKRPGKIRFSSPEQKAAYEAFEYPVVQSAEEALVAASDWLDSILDEQTAAPVQRKIDQVLAGLRRAA